MSNTEEDNEFAIRTRQLIRTYKTGAGDVQALKGIDLDVRTGTWIGVKGKSGSGKTTLLNCVGGLDRATSGEVICFGRDLQHLNDAQLTEWRRNTVGFAFQSFALLPTLSAYENIELPMRLSGLGKRRQRAMQVLNLVGLAKWMDHRPHEMSGGQQQRVAIARAIANQPKLLIADEPTAELDTNTSREILGLLRRLVAEQNLTLLMSSHDPLALEFADQVLELKDGRIANAIENQPQLA